MHLAYWSIAQTKNRETEASGMGWELFKNYLVARDKYKPDYFLYENNKSMSKAIREQITHEFGFEPVLINSALVSAQNRQRLYWVGKRNGDGTYSKVNIEQPDDRGILLRDILETTTAEKCYYMAEPARIPDYSNEKSRPLSASYSHKGDGEGSLKCDGFPDNPNKQVFDYVAEPVNVTTDGKAQTIRATCYKDGIRNMVGNNVDRKTCVAELVPRACRCRGRTDKDGNGYAKYEVRDDEKSNALDTNTVNGSMVAKPVKVGEIGNGGQGNRIYSVDGKSVSQTATSGGIGSNTGLYAEPVCLRYERTEEAKRLRKAYESHEIKHGYHELSELHPRTDGKTNTLSTVLKDNPICEPVCVAERGRYDDNGNLNQHYEAREDGKTNALTTVQKDNNIAESVRVGTIESGECSMKSDSQGVRVYSSDAKSITLCGQGGGAGAKTGLYAVPTEIHENVGEAETVQKAIPKLADKLGYIPEMFNSYNTSEITEKSPTLSTGSMVTSSCATTIFEEIDNPICETEFEYIDYEPRKKTHIVINDNAIRCVQDKNSASAAESFVQFTDVKNGSITTAHIPKTIDSANNHPNGKPIYEVRNGLITIKGKQYPIKLKDGYYIIRKLTVLECCRLQTIPDNYFEPRIEKVKEVYLKCQSVPYKVVKIPLRTERRDYVINTTCDFGGMELLTLSDRKWTSLKNASLTSVIDVSKQSWDIALCIINALDETARRDLLSTIKNMSKVTMKRALSIGELQKKNWVENYSQMKLSTTSTLISEIMHQIISMCVQKPNTQVYIVPYEENYSGTQQICLTLAISYGTAKNTRLVSNSSCYKMLGNGWTVEVIKHLLSHMDLRGSVDVLSMYDGMSCGQIALREMGVDIAHYYATEIDKYAIQTTQHNFPDTIQLGDAFQVRDEEWVLAHE